MIAVMGGWMGATY